ncbi:hypothetical protein [Cellulomonas chengniuliangii]|uniref:Uncharacterized protein n=1 Tax=Cellulomonas chengniuliangii TaxID=2968084 RepID=A0ABY5L4D7_9CELL|nr:hypothetical protein [Cellulomonas chengniuliangii]MCC2308330.1 hypothetical protein [Cellulomonas chengniuliangii]MCC2317338.1 hypothetical protein [Cellulomonas chengniuliangii]UUI76713.1 hypothetical protein NP064_07480 [Cellulomonas chengniuliangii]
MAPDDTSDPRPAPPEARPVLYVLCFGLLMLGFWLISLGFTHANGWVFGAGILSCTLAFFIPVAIGDRDRG